MPHLDCIGRHVSEFDEWFAGNDPESGGHEEAQCAMAPGNAVVEALRICIALVLLNIL